MIKHILTVLTAGLFLLWLSGCRSAETDHSGDDHEGHDHGGKNLVAIGGEAELVAFSLKLQEELPFETEVAAKRKLHSTIRCQGEIKPAGAAQAEVFAPFEAVLQPCAEHGMVRPGQRVKAGEVLVDLAPSSSGETGWQRLLKEYRLAKAEYQRVQRLFDAQAVSQKRLEEAQLDYELQESRLRGTLGGYSGELSEKVFDSHHFHLIAPAAGVISDVHLRYGQFVEAGEHLLSIIDPSKIWLEALVPISQSHEIEEISGAYFQVSGSDSLMNVTEFDGRLMTASGLLDPSTRRIPVIFELNNTSQQLRPGSFTQVYLQTAQSQEMLAVPKEAIVEEDGIPVVFRQVGQEDFEKRVVRMGIEDEGFVAIHSGVDAGDRIVTVGAYKLRMAALKSGGDSGAHGGHSH